MQIDKVKIDEKNALYHTYVNEPDKLSALFDYGTRDHDFARRLEDLKERDYNREELADKIERFMGTASQNGAVQQSLLKLKHPSSAVVVGGQQAGLLSGPMYTLHKIISIIVLARQQEEKLSTPIVPVFWIAGEDHDLLEVNHVFVQKEQKLTKLPLGNSTIAKRMVSDEVMEQEEVDSFTKYLVDTLGETRHTRDLLALLQETYTKDMTYTEWFSSLIYTWFADYGLLVMDAADPAVRELEVPFFHRLIDHTEQITEAVLAQQAKLGSLGYKASLEIDRSASNLFFYENKERELLSFDRDRQLFTLGERTFTKEELRQLVEQSPSSLSNNVVTRPLMQEFLLPTLAFIAGPGEVAYWAELTGAFHEVSFSMPPVIPRLHLTWLDARAEQDLAQVDISISEALTGELSKQRDEVFSSLQDAELLDDIAKLKETFDREYRAIEERIEQHHKGLLPIVAKNKVYHHRQLDYLVNKSTQQVERDHREVLERYDRLERLLYPFGGYQERIWNIAYFMNKHGLTVLDEVMAASDAFAFTGEHYLVKL